MVFYFLGGCATVVDDRITSLGHRDIRSEGALQSAFRVSDPWERDRREIRESIARMERNTILVGLLEASC